MIPQQISMMTPIHLHNIGEVNNFCKSHACPPWLVAAMVSCVQRGQHVITDKVIYMLNQMASGGNWKGTVFVEDCNRLTHSMKAGLGADVAQAYVASKVANVGKGGGGGGGGGGGLGGIVGFIVVAAILGVVFMSSSSEGKSSAKAKV